LTEKRKICGGCDRFDHTAFFAARRHIRRAARLERGQ
jgi:hypothetical protein